MEFALIIWIVSMLPKMSAFIVLFIISIIVFIIVTTMVYGLVVEEWFYSKYSKLCNWLIGIVIALSLVQVVLPSERTAWLMIGGYAGQKALESDTAKKVGLIVEKKLDTILQEMQDEASKKIKEVTKKGNE